MKFIKKIMGIVLGTMLLGLGVALSKSASLGQDPLSGFLFSFVYLFDEKLPYSVYYTGFNFILLILMLIYTKNKINIGTIICLLCTGVFSDLFYLMLSVCNFIPTHIIIRLIITILGIIITCFGIALYGSANLGLSPYEALPLIINKKIGKIKFQYARIITDVICTIITLIIGVVILNRSDLININTILNFIFAGPLISIFSKIVIKYYYKEESSDFL